MRGHERAPSDSTSTQLEKWWTFDRARLSTIIGGDSAVPPYHVRRLRFPSLGHLDLGLVGLVGSTGPTKSVLSSEAPSEQTRQ